MIDPNCGACRAGWRHDERQHPGYPEAECTHRHSPGVPAPCCRESIEARLALIQAVWASARGAGPKTPAQLTFAEDEKVDPVGAVWRLMAAEE